MVNIGADVRPLESDRPVIYSLEEIEEATNNLDETRRIGVGGYGSLYFGILGEKEDAVKKMRSNKSKEFYAELKVLCKIHHINIDTRLLLGVLGLRLHWMLQKVLNTYMINILLDEKLRAKVADFGLPKLVEQTNDEDFIATRLVGTAGYIPSESVKELQVNPKTDVFAFGVVLSELVTRKRALFRDCLEATK